MLLLICWSLWYGFMCYEVDEFSETFWKESSDRWIHYTTLADLWQTSLFYKSCNRVSKLRRSCHVSASFSSRSSRSLILPSPPPFSYQTPGEDASGSCCQGKYSSFSLPDDNCALTEVLSLLLEQSDIFALVICFVRASILVNCLLILRRFNLIVYNT